MYTISKRWMMVAAFGHGVLLTLALTGAARILGQAIGRPLPEVVASYLFLPGSLLLGTCFAYGYARGRRRTEAFATARLSVRKWP